MSTLFISDLHLSPERPAMTQLFVRFLEQQARQARALYILGDLFEVWLGDDLVLPEYEQPLAALRQLTARGTPVYIMYGNRDFLMRDAFEEMTGASLLADESIIDLYGVPTLLLHGDTLCTDDIKYQQFRPSPDARSSAVGSREVRAVALDHGEFRRNPKRRSSSR